MLSEAKELQEAGEGPGTGPCLVPSEGARLCPHLALRFLAPDCKGIHFCCLSHPVCSILLWQPEQTGVRSPSLKSGQPLTFPPSSLLSASRTVPSSQKTLNKEALLRKPSFPPLLSHSPLSCDTSDHPMWGGVPPTPSNFRTPARCATI